MKKSLGQIAWEAAQITATRNWADVDEPTRAQFDAIGAAAAKQATSNLDPICRALGLDISGAEPGGAGPIGAILDSIKTLQQNQALEPAQAIYQYRDKESPHWIECDSKTQAKVNSGRLAGRYVFRTLYSAPLSSAQLAIEHDQLKKVEDFVRDDSNVNSLPSFTQYRTALLQIIKEAIALQRTQAAAPAEPIYQYRIKNGINWIDCDSNTQADMNSRLLGDVHAFRTLYSAPPLAAQIAMDQLKKVEDFVRDDKHNKVFSSPEKYRAALLKAIAAAAEPCETMAESDQSPTSDAKRRKSPRM